MEHGKTIAYILFFFILYRGQIASAEDLSMDGKNVAMILQSLVPYNSIECSFIKEVRKGSNGAWQKESKGTIFFDKQKASYRVTEVRREPMGKLLVVEKILKDGKVYQVHWELKEGKEFEIVGTPLSVSGLSIGRMFDFTIIDLWENAYKVSGKHILDLYHERKIKTTDFLKGQNSLKLEYNGSTFVFDKKTGLLLSKARVAHPEDKTVFIGNCIEFSDHANLKGWNIPLSINVIHRDWGNTKEPEKWRWRYILSKDSIRINEYNPKASKFSYQIPKGTFVYDTFLGVSYRSMGTDGSIPVEDISGELDAIFEEAEKKK